MKKKVQRVLKKVVAVSTKREIGEERLRGAHTRRKKKRGVYTLSIIQKKRRTKKKKKKKKKKKL